MKKQIGMKTGNEFHVFFGFGNTMKISKTMLLGACNTYQWWPSYQPFSYGSTPNIASLGNMVYYGTFSCAWAIPIQWNQWTQRPLLHFNETCDLRCLRKMANNLCATCPKVYQRNEFLCEDMSHQHFLYRKNVSEKSLEFSSPQKCRSERIFGQLLGTTLQIYSEMSWKRK